MSRIITFKSSRSGEGSCTSDPHGQTCTETRLTKGTSSVSSDLTLAPPPKTPKVWGRAPVLNLKFKFKFRFGGRTPLLSLYPPTPIQEEKREGRKESSATANGAALDRLIQVPGVLSPFVRWFR